MAKKRGGHAGGHGWFVTFADLMGLLLSFFVMLVAFSSQDKQKLQIVAGSMRDAFGVQMVKYNGIVEQEGLPTRPTVKNVARIKPEDASNTPGPIDPDRQLDGIQAKEDRSMFPDGAKEPYDRTRRIIQKLAVPLKQLPNRISITGHTAANRLPPRPGYGPWELSADRANSIRQILEDVGLPSSHIFAIAGKADSQ